MIFNKLKPITPSDLYVSCTVFDRLGNITAVSRKYPKMQFLKDNHLFPRDLRKIDTSSIEVVPVIMIRPSTAILVNLLHIKAIIKKDSVMVFDTSNSEIATKLGIFMYDLELKLKSPSNNICYEFRALESILVSIMSYLEAEIKVHRRQCGLILAELEDEVDRQKLQELLVNSKKLSSFHQRAILIRDVLEELLDNDEDLAGMYLTDPKNVSDPEEGNYEEIESILESYYRQCDEFVQQAGSLLNDIKATEEIVNIILDANRNSLMLFELKVTVYTLGFTVATLLPAFYGMNLKNYIEESNWGFGMVVVVSVLQGLAITWFNFRKLSKVQKLTMMGANHQPKFSNVQYPPTATKKHVDKWKRGSFLYKLFFGSKFDRPTNREKDAIWRMINDDKPMK
ncbi:MRS2 Mitochondrial inner membrane magnesium transporter MRS2 [Candida maltosa Xu316]